MKNEISRATKKLQKSVQLLEYRRLNWRVETRQRVWREFQNFVGDAKKVGFPLDLQVRSIETVNEGLVQITAAPIPTGTINRKHHIDPFALVSHSDTSVIESGGELVASISATGFVHFVIHPRQSERIKPKQAELILFHAFDPTEVTVSVIQKALKNYLLILQSSSILGCEDALTIREKLSVFWIYFRDMRNKYALYVSLLSLRNEWGKALVAAAFAFLIGYITGNKN
ncbi:MAG: hypothetical protein K0M39_09740 [Rhizobium sp.]|nr:hypothetical protein [Rhizobium sp.]